MLQATGGDDSIDLSVAWPVRGDIWPDLIAPNGIDLINQDATLQGMVDETQPWTAESSLWGLARQSLGMEAVPIPESPPSMTITHELANLSIALSELARQLPSTEEHETCARDESSCDTRREMPFVFDDLFRLTTKFIDLVKRLLRGRGLRDEATALMVGSCHSRLAEMYTIIFSLMRCCIQRSLAPPRPNWAMVLPSVQLGSLTSPAVQVDGKTQLPSEKVSLYIRMIAVFSSQLWAQLIDAVRGQHQTPLVDSGMTPLVHTLWTEMGDRMDILLRTINSTKSLLR
ncbi:hypothetical protein BDV59DRAFT_187357 [Aspergillus ambiguus]|uniref:uncharacterized protein n=1 Tax=Aspergillus ambiguus TaxID=176160 RepID=UPI003CCE31F2